MRFAYFILLGIVSVTMPWWLVLPLSALYAFFFRSYEIIALGVALDAYFGYALPWHVFYTVCALGLCLFLEPIRPRIALYDRSA
jgi:hypothetical protein